MRAVRFHGPKDIRVDSVPEPACGNDQVKLRPAFVGICGTDLHEYLAGPILTPTKPHPLTNESNPVTLGHEFSGTVTEVGHSVVNFKPGDMVVVLPIIYDGSCDACARGYINCCENLGAFGFTGWGGGLSDSIVVPQSHVYRLPRHIPLEIGALIEPLSVAWHAVKSSPFKTGDSVLVLGGGPIGIGILQVLKALNAGRVIVSEISTRRNKLSVKFGADHVIDPREEDVASRCYELCDRHGVDIVFDTAGMQAALDSAFSALRTGGTVVNIASWRTAPTVNIMDMIMGEKKYMAAMTYVKKDFEEVLDAVDKGLLQPGQMITSQIELGEVVEKGFKELIDRKDEHLKILVKVAD
ncbi:hypothetical protein OIDMADRAFT_108186 [Oidiodendron maius Zn]|uniref:Enoyl reductase (ER) domain-containing protein n=1 Tax=Oidiodendron maius (strain Zn) TaxID=913774 RepID=A0A0C3D642_OIDMZ|nr:hypothetical protein OIDMADRAFT_108186 [Oidiodendron maius Zn]